MDHPPNRTDAKADGPSIVTLALVALGLIGMSFLIAMTLDHFGGMQSWRHDG